MWQDVGSGLPRAGLPVPYATRVLRYIHHSTLPGFPVEVTNMPEDQQQRRIPEIESATAAEADAIRKIIDLELQLLKRRVAETGEHPVRRGQHPKHHGCVAAEFVIAEDVPSALAVGLFSTPGKRYEAWVRFSNARKQDDREPGGHGMAIKLMGVPGQKLLPDHEDDTTHDFILLDSPVFFIKNAMEFAEFDAAVLNSEESWFGKLSVLTYFLTHLREAAILHKIERNHASNPLDLHYWSGTPYALGGGAIKYLVVPQAGGVPITVDSSADQLRHAMAAHLQTREAQFDFCIQPQLNPTDQPIDDATHRWETPSQRVATVRIARQSFDSPGQMAFCENLSFNPWRALAEHRPLGSLNRLRGATYLALSTFRHQQNHAVSVEPGSGAMLT
jgi:hypothetical protein